MKARMIFVAVLGLSVLCSSTLNADLNEGLISYWQFDEGSGETANDSAGTNDGTIHGASWSTGQINGALSFDGVDDYVDCGDDSSLESINSVSVWIKPWPKSNYTGVIIDQYATNTDRWNFCMYETATGLYLWSDGYYLLNSDAGSVSPGNWYHAVIIWDGSIGKMYINGIQQTETTTTSFFDVGNPKVLSIGINCFNSIPAKCNFHGLIDDVRIYDRALSAEEIWQLYQGESPNVIGLEIVGPGEVAENSSASYKAIAYYDDDSTTDVTKLASWSVEPEATASIEAGVLTTKDIIKDESATIWADYIEGDVTFEAEKAIDILAICQTGTALSFDGVDDYIDCGNDSSLNGNFSGLTLMAWIHPKSLSGVQAIIAKLTFSIAQDHFGLTTHGNYVHIGVCDGSVVEFGLTDNTTPLSNNNWYHVVGTWSNDRAYKLYVNGTLVTSGTQTGNGINTNSSTALKIGRQIIGRNRPFNGSIDEVRIYNRVLSGEEVQVNMHRRLWGDEPGLVGYWGFDEGQGQIVYDLSGNGNHGQLGSTADVDASDPVWIESDAPMGLCTPYLIALGAAKDALKHKRASLKELEAALAKERTMYEALEQWLESGDFADLSKGDIVKAKQKTHSAMQHEEQSIDMLEKGFEKLLDSLIALGYGPQPPGSNWPPNVTITKPQDGAEFNPDQKIEIGADAWDYDGSVMKVEFFADRSKIGEDNDGADGWTTNWYDHPEGTYNLTAKATDDDGAATTSAAVGIRVVEEPPPPPPPPPPPIPPWPPPLPRP